MTSRRLDIGSLLCDDNHPSFSPLEVLVQAATEERKRLGVADDHPQHLQNAPLDTRQCLSPHLSRHHIDDSQQIHHPQQPLYLQSTRPHHDNLGYSQYQPHSPFSQVFDSSLEADRRRRLQESEHQQRFQHKQSTQELEYQRRQEHERAYRAQELERRRREEDHLRALEYQREHRGLQQLLVEEQRQGTERQREVEERKQSQRQFGIERHRAPTENQHSQQFINEQRQYDPECRSFFDMPPQQIHSKLSPASIPHLIPNSDPLQIPQSMPSASPDSSTNPHQDPRLIKKPRYSVSPTRHDDLERIAHDRDPMVVGELSNGRVDSPVDGASVPRRHGSHNQPSRAVAVAVLLTDKEPPPLFRAHADPRDTHKPLSPTSRRSPPGSQIGRAKAARKSDEYTASLREHVPQTTREHVHSPVLPKASKATEDLKVKQEPKPNRIDESRQKKVPSNPPSKFQFSNSESTQRDDPHEFFLHQYDQVPTPTKSANFAHFDPADMPSASSNPTPPAKGLPAAPVIVALDKELEDLISSPSLPRAPTSSALTAAKVKKQEESDDMTLAVDLAVTELVGNVENDDEKPVEMDVDVEDELLSLVDDRPPPVMNASRRPSAQQQQQAVNRNAYDRFHSFLPTIISASVQPAGSIVCSSAIDASSDRDSMPPTNSTAEHASAGPSQASPMVIAAGKTGKESTIKVSNIKPNTTSSTAATKLKAKTSSKKANPTTATGRATLPSARKVTKGGKKTAGSASGSRPASVVPGGTSAEAEAAKCVIEEEADNEDDKLYCICKTKYDESRVMIACDKCDEWYHTLCVNMPDFDVDLVDQFFCPSCIERYPQSNLRSTYKQRCLWGLRHPNPDSPKACHKAARGAFSKYCSDECGVKYMQTRVDNWAKKGGKMDTLWESVKNAERREGIVVCALDSPNVDTDGHPVKSKVVPPSKTKTERETERLKNLLGSVVTVRENIGRGLETIVCRERLLQLASERADQVGQCGWDQRLCCDDEEIADIGAGMLESYEDAKIEGVKEENDMEVDGHEEQWWCPGKKVCDRHAGWQTIRYKDVCKEKEKQEDALAKLTLRERDLRKRIEDIHDPCLSNTKQSRIQIPNTPLKASRTKLVNGHTKPKITTKGKKRKAPSSF